MIIHPIGATTMNVLRQSGLFATIAGAVLFSCATSQSQVMIRRSSDAGNRARAERMQAQARTKRLEAQIEKLTAQLRRLKALKKAGSKSHRKSSKSHRLTSKTKAKKSYKRSYKKSNKTFRHSSQKSNRKAPGQRDTRFSLRRKASTRPSRSSGRSFDRNEMRERMMKMMKARMGKEGPSSEMRERMMKIFKARMAQRKGPPSFLQGKSSPRKPSHGKAPSQKKLSFRKHLLGQQRGMKLQKERAKSPMRHRTDRRSDRSKGRSQDVRSRIRAFMARKKSGASQKHGASRGASPRSDGLRKIFEWYKRLPKDKQENLKRRIFAAAKAFREAGDHGPKAKQHGPRRPSMRGHSMGMRGHSMGMRGHSMRGPSRDSAKKASRRGMWMRRMMMRRGKGMHNRGMRRGGMHHGMRRGGMRRGGMHHGMRRGGMQQRRKGPSAMGKGGCPSGNCPQAKGGMKRKMHHRRF
jgi:hypothetical protein